MSGRGRGRAKTFIKTIEDNCKPTDPMVLGDSVVIRSRHEDMGCDGAGDEPIDQLSDSAKKIQMKDKAFTTKPTQLGTTGREIKLFANHFRLQLQDMTFHHYDIDIRLGSVVDHTFVAIAGPKEKKMRKMAQKDNIEIIEKLAKEWTEVFGEKWFVFDGLKNLYTIFPLNIDGHKVCKSVTISLNGFNDQTFEVWIQYTKEIKMSSTNDCNESQLQVIPKDYFHVLEIILRFIPTKSRIPVGRSLYTTDKVETIGRNTVMAFGHFQSINMTQSGPTLVINRTATLFRTSGPMSRFLLDLMPDNRHQKLEHIDFNADLITRLNKQLSGIRVATEHTGGRRHAIIESLSFLRPKECEFDVKKGGEKVGTNVFEYFRDHYNIELKYPDIPCLRLKGGVARYLPIELCEVTANQPILRKHITPYMTAQVVRRSGQQKPTERFEYFSQTAKSIANESKDLLSVSGIELSTQPIGLNARVLDKPNCLGSDLKLFEAKDLDNWALICLSPLLEREKDGKVRHFIDAMTSMANKMGLTVSPPKYMVYSSKRDEKTIDAIFVKALEKVPNLQLVIMGIPYGDGTYHIIKHLADIKYGLMTQCLKVEHLMDIPKGFLNNFMLKINGKLNGTNTVIRDIERPAFLDNIMIIGADVTHPAPTEWMLSSVAAAVGSYDNDFTKFSASIRVQRRSKEEIITDFDEMIVELLDQFMKINLNSNLPKGLLLFRDGVSEGQFEHVLKHEYELLKRACLRVSPEYTPKITFVVVQKRHHTRFMPQNPYDGVGRAGNIPPGTVVDNTIVDPLLFEYYLCSHTGLTGTSRPAKYVVLHDDHNLTYNEMERLSYYLCHSYVRTIRPISVPTPVMYAHLAAKRAKDHIIAYNRNVDNIFDDEHNCEERERQMSTDLQIKVNECLRNLLYYC